MKRKLISLIGIAILLAGCGTLSPTGPYKGDKILYSADLSITTAYDVMHSFVTWEMQNRVALTGIPEIKVTADNIRKNAKQWIRSAISARDAYAGSPTEINRSSLQKALDVLATAVGQASLYFNQVTKGQ